MPEPTVWPVMHYDDPEAVGRFLARAFGFQVAVEARDDDDDVVHVEALWPAGGAVVLGSAKHRDGVHGALRPGASAAYAVCEDVDAVHARACEAGGEVVQPPHDTAFGTGVPTRAFTARDPEGGLWTFGTYRGADVDLDCQGNPPRRLRAR